MAAAPPSQAGPATTADSPPPPSKEAKTYVVEHLDPELGAWSRLEYAAIARECAAAGSVFSLSSLPPGFEPPPELQEVGPECFVPTSRSIEELVSQSPPGGLAADRVCLLDPKADADLAPDDGELFDVFLFGGILGDDPPRDRTSELRAKGFAGRRLGPVQMTTDTAVRVTRMVVEDKVPLDQIPYTDLPWLRFDEHESTQMPFRYVKGADGQPVMPEGMRDLIHKDADKSIGDLF